MRINRRFTFSELRKIIGVKKWSVFMLFLTMNLLAIGQSKNSFTKLITETQTYLGNYELLNPFGDEFVALNGFGMSKDEIDEVVLDAEYRENFTQTKDSISTSYMIFYFQERIIENLELIISHSEFTKNDISQLLDSDELSIIKSDDNKLYNFSMDEKTGGSYRSRISIMYFTGIDPSIFTINEDEVHHKENDPYAVFEGDGFNRIHTIETSEGTKYVLEGSVRGCSYCFESNIMLVNFVDGVFEQDFYYSVNSRSWETGITYNHENKSITVEYETDDLTTDCNCKDAMDSDSGDGLYYDSGMEFKPVECQCRFDFDGLNFELTKESWEVVKEK